MIYDKIESQVNTTRSRKRTFCSVQFSHSVVIDSLWPYGLQDTRLPCPSPVPGACSNSCPSSRWCHLTISSSVTLFSSYPQSFPASGSVPMRQFFTSGDQSIGASASASVLPMNTQDWFPSGNLGSIKSGSWECVCQSSTIWWALWGWELHLFTSGSVACIQLLGPCWEMEWLKDLLNEQTGGWRGE